MKKIIVTLLTLFVMLSFKSIASTNTILTVEVPILSDFVFRGMPLQDDIVLQPNATITENASFGSVYFNVFGNVLVEKYNERSFDEVDLTVGYANNYNKLQYGVGLIEYIYSNLGIDNTREAYMSICYDFIIKPSINIFYDYKEADGFYGIIAAAYTYNYNKFSTTIDTGIGYASANYNMYYFGVDEYAVNDWNTGIKFEYIIFDNVKFYIQERYYLMLDDTIHSNVNDYYGDYDRIVSKAALVIDF